MEIERDILSELVHWKNSPYRKPLVLQGARQVGKSWILEKFGKAMFSNYVRVNFDGEAELKQDFARTKDPKRIIRLLSGFVRHAISECWRAIGDLSERSEYRNAA